MSFAQHDAVEVTGGSCRGARGTILLLVAIAPAPVYLVGLGARGEARVEQARLRATRAPA